MFRIFSMADDGRLYQLGSQGWVVRDGTGFPNLTAVTKFLRGHFVPGLPGGPMMADSFIALVEPDGTIRTTFDYSDALERCTVCEG